MKTFVDVALKFYTPESSAFDVLNGLTVAAIADCMNRGMTLDDAVALHGASGDMAMRASALYSDFHAQEELATK